MGNFTSKLIKIIGTCVLISFCCKVAPAQSQPATSPNTDIAINKTYDRFTDSSSVSLTLLRAQLVLGITFEGHNRQQPVDEARAVALEGKVALPLTSIILLLDDQRTTLNAGGGTVPISDVDLLRITKAKSAECALIFPHARSEQRFDTKDQQAIRQFLNEMGFVEQHPQDGICYVIDTSGSMMSVLWNAKQDIHQNIAQLAANQRFGVIAASETVDTTSNGLMSATVENRQNAFKFLESLSASGSDPSLPEGFERAFRTKPKRISFYTDGDWTSLSSKAVTKRAVELNIPIDVVMLRGGQSAENERRVRDLTDSTHGVLTYLHD